MAGNSEWTNAKEKEYQTLTAEWETAMAAVKEGSPAAAGEVKKLESAVAAAEATNAEPAIAPEHISAFARDFEHAIKLGLDLAEEVDARAKQPYTQGVLLSKRKRNINRTTVRFRAAGKNWTNVDRVKTCFDSLFKARDAFVQAVQGTDFMILYNTLHDFVARLNQSGIESKNFRRCNEFTTLTSSRTFRGKVDMLHAHFSKKIVPKVARHKLDAQTAEHLSYLKALDWAIRMKKENNARRFEALKERARRLGIFVLGGGGGRTRRRSRRAKV